MKILSLKTTSLYMSNSTPLNTRRSYSFSNKSQYWYRSVPSKNFAVGDEYTRYGKTRFEASQWIEVNKAGISFYERDYYRDWDGSVAHFADILLRNFSHSDFLSCVKSTEAIAEEVRQMTPKTLEKKFEIPNEYWIQAEDHLLKYRMKTEEAEVGFKTVVQVNFEFKNKFRTKLLQKDAYSWYTGLTVDTQPKTYLTLSKDLEKDENAPKSKIFSLELTPNEYHAFDILNQVEKTTPDDKSIDVQTRWEMLIPPKKEIHINLVLQSIDEEAPAEDFYLLSDWKHSQLAKKHIGPSNDLMTVLCKAEKGKPLREIEFLYLEREEGIIANPDFGKLRFNGKAKLARM